MKFKRIYSIIGSMASVYDFLATLVGYKKSVEYFVSQLPFFAKDHIRILDAGCGTGLYAFAILNQFKNATVTAFDLDHSMVRYIERKARGNKQEHRIRVFAADVTSSLLEIKNETFNLILTSGVLVYVPHALTVQNLSRFLKQGGYFLNISNRDSTWGRFVCKLYGCKPYLLEENISVFEKNGLKLLKNITVPKTPAASFKDALLFKKI